jgi:diaminopimelate epimerase
MINAPVTVGGRQYHVTCVSMGNPHAVVFARGIDALDLESIGPDFEHSELFPESVNTEFIETEGRSALRMRVWERGSGETMACGTGACAAAVAACLNGICRRGEDITVRLRGGDLGIVWGEETLYMRGPAEYSFTGEIDA